MRTVFNIEIKLDIPAHDEERRKALIELYTRAARTLLTQTSMVAKGIPPSMKVTSLDNENGPQEHPLFTTTNSQDLS